MVSLSELYNHLKTLTSQWHYTKAEITSLLSGKVDTETGKGLSTNDYTTAEKTKLAGITDSADAVSFSQNLTSGTKVGTITINGSGTDIYCETNTDTTYTHPSYTARTGKPTTNQTPAFGGTATVSQITSDATGHVTGATDRTIKIPNTVASSSANGLMSSTDYTKLAGIEEGATNVTVDSSLSASSSNPVANSAVQSAISSLTTRVSTLEGLDFVVITSDKGTASASTMNKLYIEVGNSTTDVYYTSEESGTYTWNKMDTDILDDLSIDWDDIENKPSTYYTHPSYTARTGVPTANQTPAFGGSFSVTQPVSDATGHITAMNSRTITLPSLGTTSTTASAGNHAHGNITNAGACSTSVTFDSNILVTNSSNTVGVATAIDVIDDVVQDLISYGSS